MIALDEELEPAARLRQMAVLINCKAGIIRSETERYRNILSYMNSLNMLDGIGVIAPFSVLQMEDEVVIKSPRSGTMVFDTGIGFDIGQIYTVADGKVAVSKRHELYVAYLGDEGEAYLVPAARSEFLEI